MRRLTAFVASLSFLLLADAHADDSRLFRLGTGGEGGSYYPIGTAIARALTPPGDGKPCKAATCGIDNLVAVAQISNGSVSNVEGIRTGALEGGIAQADIVHWAYTGTGTFAGRQPNSRLRTVGHLYAESLHLFVDGKAGIHNVTDLRGKRVSLDEPGSGTLVDARLVLTAFGLGEEDLDPRYVKPDIALSELHNGTLDAFFMVMSYGTQTMNKIADNTNLSLVPIKGPPAEAIIKSHPFFAPTKIPSGTYPNIPETRTLSVGAQIVVSAELEEDLVYKLAQILWHERTMQAIAEASGGTLRIVPGQALKGLTIPLHPGAERYYRDAGMLK